MGIYEYACVHVHMFMCTSARFITRSQRRYETQTRDNSRTPSSTTEYGLFRVSSDLRLGEHPLPVGVFPLARPQLWSPKGWPASVGALDRSLGGSRERPVVWCSCSRERTPAPSTLGIASSRARVVVPFIRRSRLQAGPGCQQPDASGARVGTPRVGQKRGGERGAGCVARALRGVDY